MWLRALTTTVTSWDLRWIFVGHPLVEQLKKTPPTFAQVNRGHFSVMFAQQGQGGPAMWMYLDLPSQESLTLLHQEYRAKGVKITEPPTDKPWDMREMLVEDGDGHILRIGAPLSDRVEHCLSLAVCQELCKSSLEEICGTHARLFFR